MSMNAAKVAESSGNVLTPQGRILWFSVFAPRKPLKPKDDKDIGQFQINLIFKKTADLKLLKEQMIEAGKENAKFAKAYKDAGGKWPSGWLTPFKRSETSEALVKAMEAADMALEDWPYYLDMKQYADNKPGIVWPSGKLETEDGKTVQPEDIYSGRWARASVRFKAYDNQSKGVRANFSNVQLLDHDEEIPLGRGRVNPESEFDAVDGAGDDSKSTDSLFD